MSLKLYTDKSEVFECNVALEGASIKESKLRAILKLEYIKECNEIDPKDTEVIRQCSNISNETHQPSERPSWLHFSLWIVFFFCPLYQNMSKEFEQP